MSSGGLEPRSRSFTGGAQPRVFGRYETLFRIAGGGMAEVYAARIVGEAGFQKIVALKRMLPTLAEDDRFVEMFLDEGRVAANITSPNVVQTLDLGRAEDDSLYLVMELVVGVSHGRLLKNVLSSGVHLDPGVGVEILAQAASGLHDAHEATTPMGDPLQLIHRDISPQNILIDRAGRTRITDFGVARAMQRSTHTQTGEVKGKMAYFAPEQARAGALDRRVDIFALGIVAWETFAGRRLFKSDNPLQTLAKITQDPIPTLAQVRPDLPAALSAVIEKALQRDRDNRYQTGRDFARALRAAVPPATPAAVGAYVREHGGDELERVEKSLKAALSGRMPEFDSSASIPMPVSEERTPPSSSQVIPAPPRLDVGTGSTATMPSPRSRALVVAAMVLLAVGVGAGAALLFAGNGEERPPVLAAPSEDVEPEPEPEAEVVPEVPEVAETEPGETPETAETEAADTTQSAGATMRRRPWMRSAPSMGGSWLETQADQAQAQAEQAMVAEMVEAMTEAPMVESPMETVVREPVRMRPRMTQPMTEAMTETPMESTSMMTSVLRGWDG